MWHQKHTSDQENNERETETTYLMQHKKDASDQETESVGPQNQNRYKNGSGVHGAYLSLLLQPGQGLGDARGRRDAERSHGREGFAQRDGFAGGANEGGAARPPCGEQGEGNLGSHGHHRPLRMRASPWRRRLLKARRQKGLSIENGGVRGRPDQLCLQRQDSRFMAHTTCGAQLITTTWGNQAAFACVGKAKSCFGSSGQSWRSSCFKIRGVRRDGRGNVYAYLGSVLKLGICFRWFS